MANILNAICVELEQSSFEVELPPWKRRTFIMPDGNVFLPVAIFFNEKSILFTALCDDVPIFVESKHIYLPAVWIAEKRPQFKEEIAAVVEKVRTTSKSQKSKENGECSTK